MFNCQFINRFLIVFIISFFVTKLVLISSAFTYRQWSSLILVHTGTICTIIAFHFIFFQNCSRVTQIYAAISQNKKAKRKTWQCLLLLVLSLQWLQLVQLYNTSQKYTWGHVGIRFRLARYECYKNSTKK